MSNLGKMMMFVAMMAMTESANPRSNYSPVNIRKPLIKRRPYVLTFGNGKIQFIFDTDFGTVEIFADKPKTAQKKLKTLNGINTEIKRQNKLID